MLYKIKGSPLILWSYSNENNKMFNPLKEDFCLRINIWHGCWFLEERIYPGYWRTIDETSLQG